MTTRIGNASDFNAVVPMMRKCRLRLQQIDTVLFELHPDAEQRFRRWVGALAEDPRATLLVAEDQGQIIGFLTATMERNPPIYLPEEYALVREWWVEPPYRETGAEEALIARAAAEFEAVGVRQIRIHIAAPDEDIRTMLEGCGFRLGTAELVMDLRPAKGK